jgi:hypothetical protein
MCGIRVAAAAATDVFRWRRLEGQPHHLPLGCGRLSLQRGRVNMIRGIRLRKCAFISGQGRAGLWMVSLRIIAEPIVPNGWSQNY